MNRHAPMLLLVLAQLIGFTGNAFAEGSTQTECNPQISAAIYTQPTQRYAHAVLGDDIEYGALQVTTQMQANCKSEKLEAVLPQSLVFEDLKPRLVDLSGDGKPEIISVESSQTEGAHLAIWGVDGNGLTRLATTPFIGTAYRWLAPIGAADLDKDGFVEIAYIDRPHLAKTLRVWRFINGELIPIAHYKGLSNHRIGENFISGGIRNCSNGQEMITADRHWSYIMATVLKNDLLETRSINEFKGKKSFADALNCED